MCLSVAASSQPKLLLMYAKHVQGMSDERHQALLQLLNKESSSLQGELVVGQLIETARSWAEQHNYPEVSTRAYIARWNVLARQLALAEPQQWRSCSTQAQAGCLPAAPGKLPIDCQAG
jgi:hypothetical protein